MGTGWQWAALAPSATPSKQWQAAAAAAAAAASSKQQAAAAGLCWALEASQACSSHLAMSAQPGAHARSTAEETVHRGICLRALTLMQAGPACNKYILRMSDAVGHMPFSARTVVLFAGMLPHSPLSWL